MEVVSIEYGTLAFEVGCNFHFVVVFSSSYFLFPPCTDKLIGDWHVNR